MCLVLHSFFHNLSSARQSCRILLASCVLFLFTKALQASFQRGSELSKPQLSAFIVFVFSLITLGTAHADCAAPGTPGVRICYPNQGSTVFYVPGIEMAATTKSGAISKVQVYDNGHLVDDFGYLPGTLYDGSIKNGSHTVTVKVYDGGGNLYQASRSFYVTGYGVGTCKLPSTVGVNLCWPAEGSIQPNDAVPVSATARGSSKIKHMSIYVDGKFLVGASGASIVTGAGVSAGRHRIAAVASDYGGHTYKTVHYFNAYYNYDCNPKSGACSPGIVINKPQGMDVPSSFQFQADVVGNPHPITSMKIYLDGISVASSGGPGITHTMTLPHNSTHTVWVKAWDSAGKTYAVYQTYYVQ